MDLHYQGTLIESMQMAVCRQPVAASRGAAHRVRVGSRMHSRFGRECFLLPSKHICREIDEDQVVKELDRGDFVSRK